MVVVNMHESANCPPDGLFERVSAHVNSIVKTLLNLQKATRPQRIELTLALRFIRADCVLTSTDK